MQKFNPHNKLDINIANVKPKQIRKSLLKILSEIIDKNKTNIMIDNIPPNKELLFLLAATVYIAYRRNNLFFHPYLPPLRKNVVHSSRILAYLFY